MRLTKTKFLEMTTGAKRKQGDFLDDQCPGLILRVLKTQYTWTIRWSPGKAFAHRRVPLGSDLDPDEAREVANKFRAVSKVNPGGSPDEILREFEAWFTKWKRRRAGLVDIPFKPQKILPPSISYKAAVELYERELYRLLRPRTAEEYLYALRRPEMRVYFERPVCDIRRKEFAVTISGIHEHAERPATILAGVLRGMWRWLGSDARVDQTSVDRGEMGGLEAPQKTPEEKRPVSKLHVPDREEVGDVVRTLRSAEIPERDRLAALLLCYTVQRRRSVALAEKEYFEDVGNGAGLWRIPPKHRKSASIAARAGHDVGLHIVPLPPSAWAVVQAAMKLSDTPYLFPAARERRVGSGMTAMPESTITHTFRDLEFVASPHDMRRAFGTTYGEESKLLTKDIGLILDHGSRERDAGASDITARHYSFSKVGKKSWRIMQGWCDFVDSAAHKDS